MVWKIYHDDGGGVTQRSLDYFKHNILKIGRIIQINVDQDREFSMEILGTKGIMLLSGCNCSYTGTGPHGTEKILRALGVDESDTYYLENGKKEKTDRSLMSMISSFSSLRIDFRVFSRAIFRHPPYSVYSFNRDVAWQKKLSKQLST